MKKMLYIMGIDWNWIYQRPQILAKKLGEDFQVSVVFPRSILRWRLHRKHHRRGKGPEAGEDHRILWTLPFQEKNRLLEKAVLPFQKLLFRDYQDFDMIYLGYPVYERYIPRDYRGVLIYDCMDDHEALYPDRKRVARVMEAQKRLVERCDVLLASAGKLQSKMDELAGGPKAVLVRNGVSVGDICPVSPARVKEAYHVGYIGTIAEWFDWNILTEAPVKGWSVTYHLVGPVKGNPGTADDRICLEGTRSHEELPALVEHFDCLIMPFVVNEVVSAVDPVKLYEYIAFGKCIISVYYEEISRFEPFVYFYHTGEEYAQLLGTLCQQGFPPKYTREKQLAFLEENSWDRRCKAIEELLDKAVSKQIPEGEKENEKN